MAYSYTLYSDSKEKHSEYVHRKITSGFQPPEQML